jgi:GNAT superfamily N-acetyltransferase
LGIEDLVTDANSLYAAQGSDGTAVEIGPIASGEHEELFAIFAGVVAAGERYPHAPPLTRQGYDQTFVEPVTIVVVARIDGSVAGAYYLKPNFLGRAAHIANAGYVVAPRFRSKGLGRLLVSDSIARAPIVGFDAIQFNLVFSSNPARDVQRARLARDRRGAEGGRRRGRRHLPPLRRVRHPGDKQLELKKTKEN